MPLVIAPRLTRRQARVERRRQFRKRIGLLGVVAIVIVAAIVVAAIGFGVNKAVTNHHSVTQTQSTLLLQIQGTDRTALGSALLAEDPAAKHGVEVLVPSRIITDVCGVGQENFGDILGLPGGVTNSQQAVTSMLRGVTINGSWILTSAQLATLVNAVHGITVDVDTNVVRRTTGGGGVVLIPPGTQKLNGTEAAEYATYSASGTEQAAIQLRRLQLVIDALAQALPKSQTAISAIVRTLGSSGQSTLGANALAMFLAGYASDYPNGVFPSVLPYITIEVGGTPSYSPDDSSTGIPALVASQLSKSVPTGAGIAEPTVYLQNGTGDVGLVPSACPKLAAHHLAYAGGGNAPQFAPNAPSVIQIKSVNDVALGDQVANALGLPTSDLRRSDNDEQIADVIVTLGSDYHS
jgi:anionic cell wall polymer biosynthesis LytR-Cps2A-Psr (LCP) family protein